MWLDQGGGVAVGVAWGVAVQTHLKKRNTITVMAMQIRETLVNT